MCTPLPVPPAERSPDQDGASHEGVLLNRTPCDNGTLGHPDNWSSWRFTTPFKQRIEHIFDGQQYIAVHETSKQGVEHWHVLVIGHDGYDATRKRIQRKLEYKDMKWWSKKNSGTFEKALAYTKKTVDNNDNTRIVQSDDWPDYEYTKWTFVIQSTIRTEAKSDKDRDWQLTYANIVTQALRYHQAHGMSADKSLKYVVQEMMEHTKWRPSYHMVKNGVPDFYSKDFEFRTGQSKKRKFDMEWWTPELR